MVGDSCDSGQTGLLRSRVSRRDVKGRRLYSALDSKVKPSKAPQSLCICICICENALCSEFQSEALQAPALSKFFALLIFHRAQYPFERSWSGFTPILLYTIYYLLLFLHCLSFTRRNIPLSAPGLFFLPFSTLQCGGLC